MKRSVERALVIKIKSAQNLLTSNCGSEQIASFRMLNGVH